MFQTNKYLKYGIRKSQFIAALLITFLNGLDIYLTEHVLKLTGYNTHEWNPLARKLIEHNTLTIFKFLVCATIILCAMHPKNHTSFRTKVMWIIVGVYLAGVIINSINLYKGSQW